MLNTGLIYQIFRREFGVNFNIFCDLLFLLVRFFSAGQLAVSGMCEGNNLFLFRIWGQWDIQWLSIAFLLSSVPLSTFCITFMIQLSQIKGKKKQRISSEGKILTTRRELHRGPWTCSIISPSPSNMKQFSFSAPPWTYTVISPNPPEEKRNLSSLGERTKQV